MAALVTQKQVLEAILTDCASHCGGDPMAKLKSFPENYYTKVRAIGADPRYPTALAAIEEACRIKPNCQHPLGNIRVRAVPHTKTVNGALVAQLATCIHDYPFNDANKADPSADADMLLTGPATDISFRYFFLHRYSLINAPQLFEDGSPLLLLALVFEKAATVEALLAVAGAKFNEKDMDDMIAQSMRLYEGTSGLLGWAQVFEDLRETMRSRWYSRLVADYKGYGKPGSYIHASVKE